MISRSRSVVPSLAFAWALACVAGAAAERDASALAWPDVAERLTKRLRSDDVEARRAAAAELPGVGRARGSALATALLEDPDVEVKVLGARAAASFRTPGATAKVLPWLSERDVRLRLAACEVARAVPDPTSILPLARVLSDPETVVRTAAAEALGTQSSAEAVQPLLSKLDDPNPVVRASIARSLARIGDPRAVVPLVGKAQDSAVEVRQSVARALGDLGDRRAVPALLVMLRDGAVEVRIDALASLGRLKDGSAVDSIAPLLRDRVPTVRQGAVVALGRIATPRAIQHLVKLLGTGDDVGANVAVSPVRSALVDVGAAAVPDLLATIAAQGAPAASAGAAWVLGELRATEAGIAIESAVRRGTLGAAAGLHALGRIGDPRALPVVLEYLRDPNRDVHKEAIAAAGSLLDPDEPDGRATEPLAFALRDPKLDPESRVALVQLLGLTGAKRAAAVVRPFVS
ncbi:MAG: HEAT repeat domain-containing protein, partial [Polyangiaceae bacterium]